MLRLNKRASLRSAWTLLGALLIVLMALAACAPAAPGPAAATPAPAKEPVAAAGPAPKYGGTVAYACISAPNHLNPYVTAGSYDHRAVGPIYETLVTFKYDLGFDYRIDWEVFPWLAEGWEQPNPTTYIFKIRKDVKWQDGVDFTADDVVFSWEYARDPKNALAMRGRLEALDTVQATDKYTVKAVTKEPSVRFLENLADRYFILLPKHVYDRGDDFKKVAIGTGPFKLKEWDPNKASIFVRNENYWQKGKPYPDRVDCIYGMDASARLAAFVSKKTDLLHLNSRPEVDSLLKTAPDTEYKAFLVDYGAALYMKLDKPPFNDIRVRRAMHLPIDRQALLKTAAFNEGIINPPGTSGQKTGWAIPQEELLKLPGYRQPKDQDIAEAKRLLAEAGYPNGFQANLNYSREYILAPKLAEPIAGQLKAIGIDLVLQGTTTADSLLREKEGRFDVALTYTAGMAWQRQMDYLYSKGAVNKAPVNDPELDKLMEAQLYELDVAKRKKAFLDMQRLLLEKLYVIPTIEISGYATWQPWVHDYYYNIGSATDVDQQNVSRMWLDVDKMPAERR